MCVCVFALCLHVRVRVEAGKGYFPFLLFIVQTYSFTFLVELCGCLVLYFGVPVTVKRGLPLWFFDV